MKIVECESCEGFGWIEEDGTAMDCEWCGGIGYTYRLPDGVDRRIPPADYESVAIELEQLEIQRLRTMGYQGEAKMPWEQEIRRRSTGTENKS